MSLKSKVGYPYMHIDSFDRSEVVTDNHQKIIKNYLIRTISTLKGYIEDDTESIKEEEIKISQCKTNDIVLLVVNGTDRITTLNKHISNLKDIIYKLENFNEFESPTAIKALPCFKSR